MGDPTLSPSSTPPAAPGHLHEHVITSLRDMVLRGELVAGRKVPEAMLCARLGISRTPLREALKVLAAEGFVALRPNRGTVVVPIDPEGLAQLFEVKGALERLIGLCLPDRIDVDALARIEALHGEARAAMEAGDMHSYTRGNHAFHEALAAGTRNDALMQTYSGLQQKILRARYAVNAQPERLRRSMADHERIMAMLRAGAALDLARCLEEHSRHTGQAMLRQLRRQETAKE